CSYLSPFINYVIDHPEFDFVDAINEGDAIAIAAGATLAGRRSVVMYQNSGLGNSVNPLTSLTAIFKIPMLVITTLRGDPHGESDEPQHKLMGTITESLLNTMQISWAYFPNEKMAIEKALDQAVAYMDKEKKPYFFVMKKNDVAPYDLKSQGPCLKSQFNVKHEERFSLDRDKRYTRTEALGVLQSYADRKTIFVATTGKTGRELYELGDLPNQFYMVGSMGCALPLGFGIAYAKPKLKVYVIDGDGALLMRTGSMATVGAYSPKNLIHILLDNEAHDSTGGQSTVSSSLSFSTVAKGFCYRHVFSTDHLGFFKDYVAVAMKQDGPTFIQLKIKKGSPKNLGRPKISPEEVAQRFSQFISRSVGVL
ncbi:MAG: phosphonopyruvate decarboxylase, partial [Deltaproteobacteria bacterium]|nr:phosphonopyruvate decarboxylase [Deltaproteobacteria bacterium]